jgi:hypothetical protein
VGLHGLFLYFLTFFSSTCKFQVTGLGIHLE